MPVTADVGAPAAVIAGLGGWLPPVVVTNEDLAASMDTSDAWIRERTGIRARRRVEHGTGVCDLAVQAGRLALRAAGGGGGGGQGGGGGGGGGADAIVLATTMPDRPCPATAPEVAARLGLTGVAAFDISAVCSGFLYGLATSAGLIAAGVASRVLLIGAEIYSAILDPADRSTAVIFGDGAGAMVLRAGRRDEPGSVTGLVLGSDGEHSDLIMIPSARTQARDHYFQMAGQETYRHAVTRMTQAALDALARTGWSPAEVDRFAAHQANARITDAVGRRLGIPADRQLSNIETIGNTAAASIPLLLTESVLAGSLTPGQRTLLAAFGGGLTWGAGTVVWPDVPALMGGQP
jgi:3-oxoacyl-[acyl-carrier-protein] synthase-3